MSFSRNPLTPAISNTTWQRAKTVNQRRRNSVVLVRLPTIKISMLHKTFLKLAGFLQKRRGKNSSHRQQQGKDRHGKENELPQGGYASDSCDSTDNSSIYNKRMQKKHVDRLQKKLDEDDSLPYVIKESDIMGRFLVASRDLEPGDVIISADPLVVGPCTGCNLICLGCYNPITESHSKCKECQWPLCGDKCPGLHQALGHSVEECSVLKENTNPDYSNVVDLKDLYQALVPLRCLLLKSSDPEKWKAINTMCHHNDIRKKRPELWKNNQLMVVDKIRELWGLSQYAEDEIHTICGILEVNAFEVGPTGASIRGLYPRAYLLAHDCTPNTTHTDDARRRLTIRAATPIRKGDAITLSYAYTLQCTFKRREHLQESKFFDCTCTRCEDPTELGTNAGTLKCPKCTTTVGKEAAINAIFGSNLINSSSKISGIVLPSAPLDQTAPWRCDTCPDYSISATSVKTLIQRINDEHDRIDINDVDGYESFLHRYRNVLHPNHYLFLSAKHSLSQLYGKVDSHLIHEMSLAQLQRKRDICRDVLQVFDVLEPGYSRLRGVTLYELHAPLMILTTREYEKKELSKIELRIRLKEVVNCLEISAKILSMEPKDSSEGIMASAAKDALRRIKDWEKIIGKI